jgi:hypothetical protein
MVEEITIEKLKNLKNSELPKFVELLNLYLEKSHFSIKRLEVSHIAGVDFEGCEEDSEDEEVDGPKTYVVVDNGILKESVAKILLTVAKCIDLYSFSLHYYAYSLWR